MHSTTRCTCVLDEIVEYYNNNSSPVHLATMWLVYIRATNGVKQGGILSQLLFCLYIGVLFHLLKQSNVGCFIGNVYMGCVGYVDDVLLAPSS